MLEGFSLERSLRPLSFPASQVVADPILRQKVSAQLRRHGMVVLRAAASAEQLERLQEVVRCAWDHALHGQAGDRNAPVLVNRGKQRAIRGYERLVRSTKAVISIRDNEDHGMLDVFHPEQLDAAGAAEIPEVLREALVLNLLERAFRTPFQVNARNLYVNRGVTSTRGFHVDGGGMKAKAFLYLSDVDSPEQGPFCYVPGSHRRPWLRWLNLWYSRAVKIRPDDCPLLPRQQAMPVLARAGDMVVAMQHGVHRGLPQHPRAERAVLLSMVQPVRPVGG